MRLTRLFDPTTPDGERIAVLGRRLLPLQTNWPGSDAVTILREWFVESLGIDPDGPDYQVHAVPPLLISREATVNFVREALLGAGPALHNSHGRDHRDDFAVVTEPECCDGDCVTVTLFEASASRARFALSWLRQAGYEATALYSETEDEHRLHVLGGFIPATPADAPAEIHAAQHLWLKGFSSPTIRADVYVEVPGPTPPVPVAWRPGWLSTDIAAPHGSTAKQRKKVANAIADSFRSADWQVDRRGPEALHICPPSTP
ncbi:hypothetical protein OG458_42245 (plasmid) [Streptomyces sp. NBC_01281]|uniref:hypothetical protein n=1 Tax=Streptomyces sp. NBC_01281 TaxID=2903811 RepID=UPI002E12C496|nr:hypothetical protein OG458_42245 [Streptomyces sp. NBC_01281]